MGVEDEFDEMRKIINRMLNDTVPGKEGENGGMPAVSRGRRRASPPTRRFIIRVPPAPGPAEPEVEVEDDVIHVTWDLFHTEPEVIRPRVSGRVLLIEVRGLRPLQRVLELPYDVHEDVAWTLLNGVVDLTLTRKDDLD